MAEKLSDASVRRFVKAANGGVLWDSAVRGFGVRLTDSGRASYLLAYRTIEGRQRWYRLGLVSEWPSVAAAREEAGAIKRKVLDGSDPAAVKKEARTAPDVNALCDRYEKEYFPKLASSTQAEWKRKIEKDIRPRLGKIKVRSLSFDDAQALHSAITARGSKREANATTGLLRHMLNRAIVWRWISSNPVKGLTYHPDRRRERFLAPPELAALNVALTKHPERQAANAIRLLMLTGARRGEVLGSRWDQFDFKAGTWRKEAADTKQRRSHLVPLPAVALQLLASIRTEAEKQAKKDKRQVSPFVFPSTGRTTSKSGHLINLKKHWQALRKSAGIPDVRLHDLRHSYASVLVSSGLSLPIIGQMLGHSSPQTTNRYAHLMLDPLKQAAERAAAIIEGRPSAEIIPLRSPK